MVAAEKSNIETVIVLLSYNARYDVFEEVTKKIYFRISNIALLAKIINTKFFKFLRMVSQYYIWLVNKVI
jgi:hypothetical protein